MSLDTPKRFDRIVAILIQLQSKRIVKAQDLADRFEVSLRTVYRDIRSLESAGVPIVSEAGVGYSIMEGYRLPPVMFTREEAASFVAAEKLMQQFTDKTLGAHYESAMYKLKSVLRGEEKDWVSVLESQVLIKPTQELFNENIPNVLQLILESVVEKRQVLLRYESFSSTEITERHIEPVGLFHENNYWYVMAFCHLRNDYRQFRTDRILGIQRTDREFSREHGSLDQYRQEQHNGEGLITVRLLMSQRLAKYLKGTKKYYGFVSEERFDDQVEMTFRTYDTDHSFARWFMMFADCATILEPESLKERVEELLENSLRNLKKPAHQSSSSSHW